jgi:hypothetical protein
MWTYHNEREQAVWIHLPPPSSPLGEAVRVGPGESISFNASGDNWLTVEDQDRLLIKSGYVWELAESSIS